MNNYSFFKYITGDSKIHLLNSKFKILLVIINIISILVINNYNAALVMLCYLLIICFMSKIKLSTYIENILVLWPLYIIIGAVLYLINFNVLYSILIVVKIIFIIWIFLILTNTTSLSEIAWGIETLFIKLKKIKFPVSKVALRVAMGIKFISTMFEQSREIRKSMAYRGIPYNSKGLLAVRKMTIPLIALSYKLSRRMVKIMKLRFYGSSKQRTNYHDNKVTKIDKILIFVSIVIFYAILWIGWL